VLHKKEVWITVFILLVAVSLTYASTIDDKIQVDFDSGTYNNTFYNASGFIQVGNSSINNSQTTEMTGEEAGLITYWRFNKSSWNGASGEVKDVLGNNNGTSVNGANTSEGLFGRAGIYDGINDYVNVGNSDELNPGTGNYTITGWAKSSERSGTNQWHLYVAKRTDNGLDGYYIGLNQESGLNFMVGDGTNRYDTRDGDGYVSVNYDEWFHFAAVIDRTNNKISLYVNGQLGATQSLETLENISNTADLSIGYDKGQDDYPVTGSVDELAFWGRTLNLSEIQELYQKGNASSEEQPASGTYESDIKDAGALANWTNISWNSIQVKEYGKANSLMMHFDGSANDENKLNNGTVYGSATTVLGKINSAYYFDGVDDYISIPDDSSLDFTSSFSLGAWVNISSFPSSGQWDGIIIKGGDAGDGAGEDHNYFLAIDQISGWGSGIGVVFGYEDSSGNNYQTRYQIDSSYIGQWLHLAGVYDDSEDTVTLYINNVQVAQSSAAGTPNTQNLQTLIGRNIDGASGLYYFNGIIDEVFITNQSLSSSQIQEIYDNNDYISSNSDPNLKFQLKTSNDNSSWSEWFGHDGQGSYYILPRSLNLSNSQYLKYKAFFENNSAKLYNISIGYELIDGISVTLNSPADNHIANDYELNFSCSASSIEELSNITLFHDKFSWGRIETKTVSGTEDSAVFTVSELANNLNWNCYVCNINGNCSFAESNYSLIIDNNLPSINLSSPTDGHEFNSSSIEFVFNVTDDKADLLNCSLLVDGEQKAINSSIANGEETSFSISLDNGNYTWKINCSDGVNSKVSEERNFSVNVVFSSFWAKANTHTHTKRDGSIGSDGNHYLSEVILAYKDAGYNILAITDHNPYSGDYNNYTPCSQYNNVSEDFICIESEELTLSSYHSTFINTKSAWPYSTNSLSNVQQGVNDINSQGGFAIIAHPSWSSTDWSVSNLLALDNYTGIEIYNKVIERLTPSEYAMDKWDDVLTQGKKIFGFAADDMHILNSDFAGGWIKVYVDELTNEEFVSRVNNGYFYSSQGPNMDSGPFELLCDNESVYRMGESAECYEIKINATISASNSSYHIQNISLINNGDIISSKTNCSAEQDCYFEYSEEISSSGYYRLEATSSNNKKIWSNPIWINKTSLPVVIDIHSPLNNSEISDYTPLLNISLNQQTSLLYSLNNRTNTSLCNNCTVYSGYIALEEGANHLDIFANNSDNIVQNQKIYVVLDFNKSVNEGFNDNSSILEMEKAFFNESKISLEEEFIEGKLYLKPILTQNNITSITLEWTENNTENAKGEGQREPILARYKFGNQDWEDLEQGENWIENGTTINGLNNHNLSIMFDFEKNNATPIYLLGFKLAWKEFTRPLISNVTASSITSDSALISWTTDLDSNSTVYYGKSSDSLEYIKTSNESVSNHSITLIGLSASTAYFYKIKSCVESSCSEDPQVPYTPYSFTTQSTSSGRGSSGGGGGGGGSTPAKNQCNDNIDNDGDKLIDYPKDPGCTGPNDDNEEDEVCHEDWHCEEWSECINGTQTRECTDWFGCGTEELKPAETKECAIGKYNEKEIKQKESNFKLKEQQKISFNYKEEKHWITVLKLEEDKTKLEIESDPINIVLNIKQAENIDIDSDGKPDIRIKLNEIKNEEADITIRFIGEGMGSVTGQAIKVLPYEKPNPYYFLPTILLLIIFIVLISTRKSRLSKKKKKIITSLHIALMGIISLLFLSAIAKNLPVGAFLTKVTGPNTMLIPITIIAFILATISSILMVMEKKKIKRYIKKEKKSEVKQVKKNKSKKNIINSLKKVYKI